MKKIYTHLRCIGTHRCSSLATTLALDVTMSSLWVLPRHTCSVQPHHMGGWDQMVKI